MPVEPASFTPRAAFVALVTLMAPVMLMMLMMLAVFTALMLRPLHSALASGSLGDRPCCTRPIISENSGS